MPAKGMTAIDNGQDLIDSRDIIERIDSLSDDAEFRELDEDEAEELKALRALQSEAEGYADDWKHGVALIRDDYFETYAQDLAEDIGAIQRDQSWPNNCIDWKEAADQLKQDYTSIDFGDVTYWVR